MGVVAQKDHQAKSIDTKSLLQIRTFVNAISGVGIPEEAMHWHC
jgi:hypothetical protein